MNTISLFTVPVLNVTKDEAVALILASLHDASPSSIFFVNAHCINLAFRDSTYRLRLQQAKYVFADGIGMKLAAAILGIPLTDNVNGTDLFPLLCEAMQSAEFRIFLLGGEPGIAERMRTLTLEKYPNLRIVGSQHGYYSPEEESQVIQTIRSSQSDLLLVALGVPKQEKWIADHVNECGVKAAIGVGGLFDFYSRKITRAPRWMRNAGLEWLYRLYQEPGRLWKRYILGNVYFLWLVMKTWYASFRPRN